MCSFNPNLAAMVKEIADQVDADRFIYNLENLIRIPSFSGEEAELAQWIRDHLTALGIQNIVLDEYNNVVARFGNGPRKLLISAHFDTMRPQPGEPDPFTPKIKEEDGELKIFGLGAASSKACIASILEAFTILDGSNLDLPSVTFVAVACDLHPTIHGIKEVFRLHHIEADGALVGEPTDLRIGMGARGYSHINVRFSGSPHHAGRPDNFRNPICGAAALVNHALKQPLPEDPFLGAATLTPIEWKSEGQRPHTPQSANILLDRRLVPEDPPIEALLAQFKGWAQSYSKELDVDIELWRHQFPWIVKKEDPIVMALAESMRVITGREPDYYPLPFSSSSGFIKNVPQINPVAFSGGDIAKIGPQEYTILSRNLVAASAVAGMMIYFASL